MKRYGQLLLCGFFLAFLYGGAVFLIVFAQKDTESDTENRTLTAMPSWSGRMLWSGDYTRDLENYVADHVAFRDSLVGASRSISSLEGIAGQDEAVIIASRSNNDAEPDGKPIADSSVSRPMVAVSQAKPVRQEAALPVKSDKYVTGKVLVTGNRAMSLYTYSPDAGRAYADTINQFQQLMDQTNGSRVHLFALIAPTAAAFVESPALRKLSDSQQKAIAAVYSQLNSAVTPVDAAQVLSKHADEELYFRTDHHWTANGAYYAYEAFMQANGITAIPLSRYDREEVHGFLGSLYSSTLSKKLKAAPDTIVVFKPYVKHKYVVHYSGPLRMQLLDMHHASKKNKYRIFLSGDRPWAKITTEMKGGSSIAVIKDSYGNAFVPFLLPHYKEIYVIDPRQFNQSLPAFIAKNGIDEVLFLNNAEITSHTGFTRLIGKLFRDQ